MLRLKSRWTSGSIGLWLPVTRARLAPFAVEGSGVEGVRVGAGPLAAVQSGDPVDLVAGQLEAEEVEVLLDAARRHRLGDDDVAELQVPPQDRLGRRDV